MPWERAPKRRNGGACVPCVRKKRKCDHKQPQCSQCFKHGDTCEPRVFKRWPKPAQTDSTLATEIRQARRPEPPPDDAGFHSPRHPTSDALLPFCPSTVMVPMLIPGNVESSLFIPGDGDSFFATGAENVPNNSVAAITPHSTSTFATELLNIGELDQLPLHPDYDYDGIDAFNEHHLCYPYNTIMAAAGSIADQPASATAPNHALLEPHLHQNSLVGWTDDDTTPDRRFLWQYFIFAVKPEFMALQMGEVASSLEEFQDPYNTFLPCLALENPALRNALLCSSAVSFQHTHGRRDFDGTIRAMASEALQSLRMMQALEPRGISDWNLVATILAASYLHVQCFAWEKSDEYLHLATYFAQTLFTRRSRVQHAVAKECLDMTLVTYRWSMISTLCSLRKPQKALIPKEVCRVIELDGTELGHNFSTTFQDWVSHPLYVFSPRLVNPLLRIGKLLEQQLLVQPQSASDPTVDGVENWKDEIADVERMLLRAREADMDQVAASAGGGEPKIFLSVNEATYATTIVLLNARLKGMPYTAPLIREHVELIIKEISGPALNSRLSRTCAFYLFIAGCEAVDTHIREAIESRLKVLTWSVFSNVTDLCASLRHVWKIRDQEPGLAWPHWAQKTASNYRVECLY